MRDVTLNNWVKLVRTRMDVVAVEKENNLTRSRFLLSWSPSLPDQKSQPKSRLRRRRRGSLSLRRRRRTCCQRC